MTEHVHPLTYRRPADQASIRLEQVSWEDLQAAKGDFTEWLKTEFNITVDTLKYLDYTTYLNNFLDFYDTGTDLFEAHVRIYRMPDQKYTPVLSHGIMGKAATHKEKYEKVISVTQDDKFSVDGVLIESIVWDAGPHLDSGEIMSPLPAVTITDNHVTLSKIVAKADVLVKGQYHYDLYKLTIAPRFIGADAEQAKLYNNDDRYHAKFQVFYGKDQVEELVIKPPERKPGGKTSTKVDPDEEEPGQARRVIPAPFLYCNGEEIDDFTFYANGAAIPKGESVIFQPGVTEIRTTGQTIADTAEDSLENNDRVTI